MTRRFWTPEEDAKLRVLCMGSKMPVKDMTPLLDRSAYAVQDRLRHLGLSNDYNPKKYTKDESFFETPNPVNSYYAGLIAADGSVDWGQHCVRWSLEKTDLQSLETFRELTGYTGRIGYREKRGLGKDLSRQCYLDIYSAQQWCDDLHRNFGIVPTKAHRLAPPNTVNDLLNLCFILGYIDGDGSLSFTEKGGWTISIASASPLVLEFIKSICDRHFHPSIRTPYSKVCRYDNHYVYSIKGYRAIQLFDTLRALPTPKMARKWENPEILRVIAARKAQHPELYENVVSFDAMGTMVRHATVEPIASTEIAA